jgi:hypothetical protein
MSVRDIITAAAGAAAATQANYIEDCFSCHLYTGNGGTQTITNGIDLDTKGGLVWIKNRNTGGHYNIYKSGSTYYDLIVNSTGGAGTNNAIFNVDGFTIPSSPTFGVSNGDAAVSWTFRKQPKFFDIVTYTGTGSNRTIPHALGSTPGMIIIKRTNADNDWWVYHRSLGNTQYIRLNTAQEFGNSSNFWLSTTPTSTVFSLGNSQANVTGATYVAYLFAHDAGGFGAAGTDSVVSCGSYSTSGTITLGWEPQFILIKKVTNNNAALRDWAMFDNMRGLYAPSTAANELFPNTSSAEVPFNQSVFLNQTGFTVTGGDRVYNGSDTYIYLAIRRGPMKTPTDATKVFSPITSSASTGTKLTTGFPVDMQIATYRAGTDSGNSTFNDRLRGSSSTSTEVIVNLVSSSTGAEVSTKTGTKFWDNTGFQHPDNLGSASSIFYNFRRAPGFFDVVCYTGTGSATTVAHNLGVAPELIIAKGRSNTSREWVIYHKAMGYSGALFFDANQNYGSGTLVWNDTNPSSSVFSVGTYNRLNGSAETYVAYLFASCPGVSKVGSYTGNGSSQTIDCGFAAGARFVLIKRTDSTGDWYVWDTARGIVSGNDPHLSLNTTDAEVTTNDTIDPASSGFIVNQVAATNVNVSSGTFIYLAIA